MSKRSDYFLESFATWIILPISPKQAIPPKMTMIKVFSLIPIENKVKMPQINKAASIMPAIPKSMYAIFFMFLLVKNCLLLILQMPLIFVFNFVYPSCHSVRIH